MRVKLHLSDFVTVDTNPPLPPPVILFNLV